MLTLQAAIEQLPLLKRSQTAAHQVNMACERLLAMGKFKGWTSVVNLKVYENGTITLPSDWETILGAALNSRAQLIRDPWYEFTPRPNALFSPDPRFYAADLGDRHVTYRAVSGAQDLKVTVEDAADLESTVSVKVRRTADEGVAAEVAEFNGPISDVVAGGLLNSGSINEIVEFSKPRTAGEIALSALLDGVWVEVGRFQPRDTSIRLRKYSIPEARENDVVTALCKKRFRPVEDLTDELPVESIYCLRMALEALLSETDGDLEKSNNYWGMARRALADALSEHRSSAVRTVPIYCRAAAGSKLRAIR